MPEKPVETNEDQDDELTPFERFETFARKLVGVPRQEINEAEREKN